MVSTIVTSIFVYLFAITTAKQTKKEKDELFFQGIDTGFLLRNNTKGYEDYDCPDLPYNKEFQDTIQKVFTPITMLASLSDEPAVKKAVEIVKLYLEEI